MFSIDSSSSYRYAISIKISTDVAMQVGREDGIPVQKGIKEKGLYYS
jgi:hypothetical protein